MSLTRVALLMAVAALVAGCAGAHEGAAGVGGEGSLRFVVMGDNQPEGTATLGQPEVYKQIIREINRLQPDLVVQVGDQISGYAADEELIHRMWDEFLAVRAGYTMPSYVTPGNHDVWDERSEAIFKERVGKLYHSFDRGHCHFIVLNSENQHGPRGQIWGDQLAWLKEDLAAHRDAAHTFVFLHQPLWLSRDWQTYQPSPWDRDVHPLLVRHGVSAVFCGHWHAYVKDVRDGIRYIVTGGAGGPMGGEETPPDPKAGEFFHYCLVTVTGDDLSLKVIRPYGKGVLDENVVLYGELPRTREMEELWELRAQAWALRRQGKYREAAEVWKRTLAYANKPFGTDAKTTFEEVEDDLRSAGRLDDYAAFLAEQHKAFPSDEYAMWRDLTLARVHLERGQRDRARALYRTLLERRAGDHAVVGQVYHDVAVGEHGAALVKVEGEDFADQGGGRVRISDVKVRVSGKTFTGWDNPGHWLQWRFDVPREGTYYVIFRFAHGFQDEEGTYRVVTIDGQEIERSYFWYSGGWASWADDWASKLLSGADGAPRGIRLTKGIHTLRMEAPPGKPKGLNLDYILLVPAFDVPHP